MPCYVWQGKGADNINYGFALCVPSGSTVSWITGATFPSGTYKLPAVNGSLASGATGFYVTPDNIVQANNQAAYNTAVSGRSMRGNCTSCLIAGDLYDCINGACFKNSVYDTPGFYTSLEQCKFQCGGTVCSGKCISNADWAQIEGLASKLKSKNCS
jgi:hypothetical protein